MISSWLVSRIYHCMQPWKICSKICQRGKGRDKLGVWDWRIHTAVAPATSLQLCLILCDPRDSSPPGSPIPGILQARTLDWVAISFSNAWKWKVKVKSRSHVQLLATPWTRPLRPWNSPGKSTGVGCHCLLHIYTLLYLKQLTSKDLLYSTGNTAQYSVIIHTRKES